MATKTTRSNDRGHGASAAPPAVDEALSSPAVSPDTFPDIAAAVREPAAAAAAEVSGPAPSREPGQAVAGVGESLGKITHLWSYDSPVGTWVFLEGIGWRRISPASEHGNSHMTVLAAIATNADIPVYYNLDGSGQIDRLYV